MIRIELIANRSVQRDLIEALESLGEGFSYTLLPLAHGRARGRYRLGTATWPEENFVLLAYVSPELAREAADKVRGVIKKFPQEGIAFFTLPGGEALGEE
ncbi:MAG: hypothetical protein LBQ61_05790 [Spirochaetales bacterium]|jgi:hypothetical protein|nr:hypothetical protein [Spirochaetales bacterium]